MVASVSKLDLHEQGRVPTLDGVRGIAILMVMILHFWGMVWVHEGVPETSALDRQFAKVVASGWIGVELFFVLSGFLITRILLESKAGAGYFRTFYIRRALRIFPAYYLFLAFSIFILPSLGIYMSRSGEALRSDQLWLWTYTINIAFSFVRFDVVIPFSYLHLWSLAFEEQFYLVWPLIVLLLSRRTLIGFCVVMFVVSLVVRIWMTSAGAADTFTASAPRQLVPAHADTLVLGALLALVADRGTMLAEWRANIRMIAGGAVIVLVTIFVSQDGLDPQDRTVQTVGFAAISLVFAGFVYEALSTAPGSVLSRGLTNGALVALGRYSYVMYLWHILIGNQVARAIVNLDLVRSAGDVQILLNVVFVATAIGVTFVFGALSWRFFEAPILSLKNRVPYGTRHRETTELAEAAPAG